MYLSNPCEQLFAHQCENNNQCSFNVMKPKAVDFNCNGGTGYKKSVLTMDTKIREVRNEELLALRSKFPTKIPIIIKKYERDVHLPQLDKFKYLVPQDITMSQFQTIIRSRLKMSATQALYLLINNSSMVSLSLTLGEVYNQFSSEDGYLYITYASQEVFGGT